MANVLLSIVKKNTALMFSVMSSASSFFINIWLKSFLSAESYGDFSLIFFAINTIFILAIAGYDQVLIKCSERRDGLLIYDRNVFNLGIFVFFLSPFLSVYIINSLSILTDFSWLFVLISFLATFLVFNSILFNLTGDLAASYFYIGMWRVVLLVCVLFLSFFYPGYREYDFVIFFSMLATVFAYIFVRPRVAIADYKIVPISALLILLLSSLFSLTAYQLFESLDRILINSNFDKKTFGDYFFLFSVILAPVAILSTYYSSKNLFAYKKSISIAQVKRDFYISLALSSIVAVAVGSSVFYLANIDYLDLHSIDLAGLVLIIILCSVRGGYAALSMAYKVVAKSRTLFLSSVFFCFISLLVYVFFEAANFGFGIKSIMFAVCLTWLLRCVAYILIIENDLKGNF